MENSVIELKVLSVKDGKTSKDAVLEDGTILSKKGSPYKVFTFVKKIGFSMKTASRTLFLSDPKHAAMAEALEVEDIVIRGKILATGPCVIDKKIVRGMQILQLEDESFEDAIFLHGVQLAVAEDAVANVADVQVPEAVGP